jgi:glycosyltransferase involved in cell wall biosynthesis
MSARRGHALVLCPLVPYPPNSGGQKRTLRLLEAAERAGAVPHLLCHLERTGQRGAEALRERGWRVELLTDRPPSIGGRVRQLAARRPGPYSESVAQRLRDLRSDPPSFVQAEHFVSAYYEREHPVQRWALSSHNIDSEMVASVARSHRPLSPGWALAWNHALATRTVERRVSPRADAVICTCEGDAEHFAALGAQVVLAPNGVDEEYLAIPEQLPASEVVLFVGRLDYAPNSIGLERFLRHGWPRLAAARPQATLRVVGGGIDPLLAEEVARTPGAEVAGEVPDMGVELAAARVVVVPIWHGGGTRLKVLEALAAARPLVGTPLGVSEVGFVDGRHGLVADEPAGLADAAASLLGDAARSTELALAGRELGRGFVWSRALAGAEELYARWVEEAAAEPSRRP